MRFSLALAATLLAACTSHVPAATLTVSSIAPDHGSVGGGTIVTLTGVGLDSARAVAFGSTLSPSVMRISDTQITAVTPPGSGPERVFVYDAHYGIPGPLFTYGQTPHLLSLTPTHASAGDTISINGGALTGVTQVSFGTTLATEISVVSDSQITAVVPAGTGAVTVTASTAFGTSNGLGFGYDAAAPTLSGLSPSSGPAAGGTMVTITGTNLGGTSMVMFGSAQVDAQVLSETSVTAIAPAGTGTVDVTLVTPSGTSNALPYTYIAPMPTIASITPTHGPADGGTSVVIAGTDLGGTTGVTFDGTAATFTIDSDTQLTITTPPHAPATVDVVVTTSDGFATATNGYTYDATTPTVTSVSPAVGPSSGGTVVTLDGTGFVVGDTSVTLSNDAIDSGSITVLSATELTFITPAHSDGTCSVRVVTSQGTSPPAPIGFTFRTPPTATSMNPTSGSAAGGTLVTISGTNFVTGSTSVTIGGLTVQATVIDSTSLTFTTPAHASGNVDVTVITAGGSSSAIPGGFTYE